MYSSVRNNSYCEKDIFGDNIWSIKYVMEFNLSLIFLNYLFREDNRVY